MDFLCLIFPSFLTLPIRFSSCWFLRIIPWRQTCILTLIKCFWNIATVVRGYAIDQTAPESIPGIWWMCPSEKSPFLGTPHLHDGERYWCDLYEDKACKASRSQHSDHSRGIWNFILPSVEDADGHHWLLLSEVRESQRLTHHMPRSCTTPETSPNAPSAWRCQYKPQLTNF